MKTRFILFIFLAFVGFQAHAQEVFFETDSRLPVVYLNVAFFSGAADDPAGKFGLASFTSELMSRGTKKHPKNELDRAFDQIGAQLGVESRIEITVFRGAVLASKLDHFLSLLEEILTQPLFDRQEAGRLKNETVTALIDGLTDDRVLASRHFERKLFGSHPYSRNPLGKIADVKKFSTIDAQKTAEKYFVSSRMMVLGTGDAPIEKIRAWTERVSKLLPKGTPREPLTNPEHPRGMRVFLVDKPERTQSQVYAGQIGPSMLDPDYFPLVVGNEAFGGGAFSSRLMVEIRAKKGWSYGANSFFKFGSRPHAWKFWTFPGSKVTPIATQTMIQMIRDLKTNGITTAEFDAAKAMLVNSAGFKFDTPHKRVENILAEHSLGLPEGFFKDFGSKVEKVTLAQVNEALKRRVEPENLTLAVLGTSKNLKEPLAKSLAIPAKEITVLKYTDDQ